MIALASSPVAALTSILTTDTAWQLDGLCNQTDPDAFFPERGSSPAHAKTICMGCPVRATCLEYALNRNERHGVWGGMTEDERRQLRRRRIAQASKPAPVPAPVPVAVPAVAEVPPTYGGGFPPAPCGTEAAHRRHKRRKEPIDKACADAHIAYIDATREARREWRRRSRARVRNRQGPRVLEPCGTPAAYSRHKRRGEKACDACRLAHNKSKRMYTQKQKTAPTTEAVETAREARLRWNNPKPFLPDGWRKPKLTNAQWAAINERLAAGETAQDVALDYSISAASIRTRAVAS